MNKKLTIVLPCYNPPEDWVKYVSEAYFTISKQLNFEPELIIVNDGSTKDVSAQLADLTSLIPHLQYINMPTNKGKGAALRVGVAQVSSDFTIYTDIDFPYTVASFMAVYDSLSKGNDVAIGIKDKTYYQHSPKYRTFISKVLRKGIGFFFNMPITDTQCGLKGFNAQGKSVFVATTIDRYLFDLEFVYQSFRKNRNLKVDAIEASLRPNVIFRAMNLKVLMSESKNFMKILLSKNS